MADDFDPYYQWLGIPPKQQPPSQYRLLALEEFESNADVIENAADQRMAHVRQFQSGSHGEISQRLLNEITSAKLCLLNLAKKAEYDQKLRAEKDAAEPRRLRPFPRLEPTSAPTESYQLARDPEPPAGALAKRRRHLSPQLATMGGTALGLAVVCAIAYVSLSQNQPETPVNKSSNSAIVDAGKSIENGATVPRKTAAIETKSSEPEESAAPKIKSSPTIDGSADSVFLDDLQEKEAKVGHGSLGKHGSSGHPGLPDAVFRGAKVPHALVTLPATRDKAYVVYELNGDFKSLHATAGLLEVPNETLAGCDLTFAVYGDEKLLWRSEPIRRLGTGQPLVVDIRGVKALKLQVECPGAYDFAWAAWLNPALSRTPSAGGAAPLARAGNVTSLANPNVRFTVPQEHYAVLRAGEVEAVIVDNAPVDNDVLRDHREGFHGVGSLTHKGRPLNLFVPLYCGLHLAVIYDGTNRAPEVSFDSRHSPMEVRVVSQRIVELYQKPTITWGLENAVRYELLDDGAIEVTFECIPRKPAFTKGYIGLYFPSYIDPAEAQSIHFLGHDEGRPATANWIRAVPPANAQFSTHLAAGDRREFQQDTDFRMVLAVNHSQHRYDEPWFYGVSHGMAFVQMFRAEDQVRFAQAPNGGAPAYSEWGFHWLIPNYEVGKLYRLVMRAMYVPFDALHLGLVEPHLGRLNGDGAPANPPPPQMAFLDDLAETAFKVGVGTLGKHGERGYTGDGVPDGRVLFQGRNYAHALSTHPAAGDVAHVIYKLDGKFSFFRAQAVLMDVTAPVRTPVLFRAVADGRVVWSSAPLDRASVGQLCSVDIKGTKTLRLEVQSAGDNALQCAAWLNPLVSALSEPPVPTFSRTSTWAVEGTEFKFAESEKGMMLEMVPGTSKVYAKIQIPLIKSGQSWVGIGDLYFRSSPTRRYEAKVEVPAEDIFHSKSLKVRTICPDLAAKTKMADITSTWTKKE